MAHLRARHIESHIARLLKASPIVGVFGHRQVGKTTVAERVGGSYVTMDRQSELASAERDAEMFLDKLSPTPAVIDECQLAPALFPALKERVRTRKEPGIFGDVPA